MNSKVVDALQIIIEEMRESKSLEDINILLGSKAEIDTETASVAFSLLFDKVLQKIEHSERTSASLSFRVADEEEISFIGIDNYDYLLHLFNLGIINSDDLELILEQVVLYPKFVITKQDINLIVLFSLMEVSADLLPGSRFYLHTSDKIN
jgi:uncharacterized protein Smg (DUF494 family)